MSRRAWTSAAMRADKVADLVSVLLSELLRNVDVRRPVDAGPVVVEVHHAASPKP